MCRFAALSRERLQIIYLTHPTRPTVYLDRFAFRLRPVGDHLAVSERADELAANDGVHLEQFIPPKHRKFSHLLIRDVRILGKLPVEMLHWHERLVFLCELSHLLACSHGGGVGCVFADGRTIGISSEQWM